MIAGSGMLRWIALSAFCSLASMRICDPMLIAIGAEFDASAGEASSVVSVYALAYGVMQFFYGPLGDRIGKLRVITCATLGCAVLSAVTALAPSLELLVASRATMGAAAAGIVPLSIAWIGDQVSYEGRQETLARLSGAMLSGMMAGVWFGGYAAQTLGWRSAFWVLSAAFLFAAVAVLRRIRHSPASAALENVRPASDSFEVLRLFAISRVRWVLAVTALEGVLAYGTLAFFPSLLVQKFGLLVGTAGATMMLFGVGGLMYSQFAGRWLALLGERGLTLCGGGLFAACLVVLAWNSTPAWLAIASCLPAGVGLYMLHSTLQTQATQMAPHARGAAVALFACVLFLGQAIGVLVVARFLDDGVLVIAFAIAAVGLAVLSACISRQVGRPHE